MAGKQVKKIDGARPKVLIADDDPEILAILRTQLTRAGYPVFDAMTGDDAITLARQHQPDVVVLDVMMPGRTGWEVAKELRHDDRLREVGIVMLTAIGPRVNELTSPLYGTDDHLDKPFEFEVLLEKIEAAYKLAQERRAAAGKITPPPFAEKARARKAGGAARTRATR